MTPRFSLCLQASSALHIAKRPLVGTMAMRYLSQVLAAIDTTYVQLQKLRVSRSPMNTLSKLGGRWGRLGRELQKIWTY